VSKKEVSVLVKPTATADTGTTKAIDDLRKEVQGRSFTDGSRLLSDVDLVAGTNRIPHGLGRRPKGYLVVGRRAVVLSAVSETRIVAPSAFNPQAVASWTHPAGAGGDFWIAGATTTIVAPLPVKTGETITGAKLVFYRGQATDPTVRLLAATLAAAATVATPTVAWTTPSGTGSWEILTASYSEAAAQNHWSLDILARNLDRVRHAFVTVESTPTVVPELTDEHDEHTDTDTFLYLVATGFTATVDLLIF
jgi:hypothetical protein